MNTSHCERVRTPACVSQRALVPYDIHPLNANLQSSCARYKYVPVTPRSGLCLDTKLGQ